MDNSIYQTLQPSSPFKIRYLNKLPSEPDRQQYIQELKRCSPIRPSPTSSIPAAIPYDLGRSEKFIEKHKVLDIFRALNFIDSHLPAVKPVRKAKNSTNDLSNQPNITGYSHLLFRKVLTPFSSGVVRIKSQSKIRILSKTPSRLSLNQNISPINVRMSVDKSWEKVENIQNIKNFEKKEKISGFVDKKYENGDWYKGNMIKSKRHGKGEFFIKKFGMRITGSFYKNRPDGPCVVEFLNGYKLDGVFNDGHLEDTSGNIFYSDKSYYQGDIKQGERHGIGIQEYPSGTVFKGGFVNDLRNGACLVYKSGKFFFEGTFAADSTSGPGVLVFFNAFRESTTSDYFPSLYKDDYFYDYMKFTYFDSNAISNLDLVFMTQSANSNLIPKDPNKTRVFKNGEFISGRLEGVGHAKYGHVGEYFGEFKNGKRHGYGLMKYTDPEHTCEWFPETEGTYLGEWRDDKRHGYGIMVWANGTQYKGTFMADRRDGVVGKVVFANGDSYEGGFVNDNMLRSTSIKKLNQNSSVVI